MLPLIRHLRLGHLSLPSLRHRTCLALVPPDMVSAALFAKVRWAHETMEQRSRAALVADRAQAARLSGSPSGHSVRFAGSNTRLHSDSNSYSESDSNELPPPPPAHLGALLRRDSSIEPLPTLTEEENDSTGGLGSGSGGMSPDPYRLS